MATLTCNFNTFASSARTGTNTHWSNAASAVTSNDVYATLNGVAAGTSVTTHYLTCTQLVSAIPSGTINGITISIERKALSSTAPACTDLEVKLVKAGTIQSTNKAASAVEWPSSDGVVTYGGVADLWGTTWTTAEVNASGFGVVLAVTANGISGETTITAIPFVDQIFATITYTPLAGAKSPTTLLLGMG